ncbi:G patch domain-containing protein, N-terminal [Dillenia turbinata]|uniref:G patch domain-containing protein, N-terminal n=1 Tax=Dillenia turbinata TaxID=194707 RepID=A0AAN8V1V0_9MAGN
MDAEEEDYVFVGTPIEREEDLSSRKKKALAEASGNLRALPPWKQEVIDEEGRRRFHGAFTGGFSAGYYNTVGSKEGWTPQKFTSSRKNRAEVKEQSIFNFLDEDEKAEMEGRTLGTSSRFDTFGFTAAEFARKQAEKEQQQRPSIIPGPVPDELVLPATNSIGVKLLLKMGWRHGHSIKDSHTNSLYDTRREARKAFLALSSDVTTTELDGAKTFSEELENKSHEPDAYDAQPSQSTPVYLLNPKQDLHGLGYDPFKHAPEFRAGKVAPGFGIGALEELDFEDEDVYHSGYDFEETHVQDAEEPTNFSTENKPKLALTEKGILHGFKVASKSDYQLERSGPPDMPADFIPRHTFATSLEIEKRSSDPPPPDVPPPEDNDLKILIDGFATLVARCGKLFEDLSREKNKSNPLFSFLTGGNGHDYYTRKLWEERQKRGDSAKQRMDGKSHAERMTAESRGKILGETPLERTSKGTVSSSDVHLQLNLSDTFTKSAAQIAHPELAAPFRDDPTKQERFERFLKEKYQGGLRAVGSAGASNMSEDARARERLDFEAAAEAIEKGMLGKEDKLSVWQLLEMSTTGRMQFTSGGLEQVSDTQAELLTKKMYPKREEFQWRPSPLLCKRFDLVDPFMGKPPPAPRSRSKMDSLIFTSDAVMMSKFDKPITEKKNSLPESNLQDLSKEANDATVEVDVQVENVERPVDLYKAIFSDDSDNEENSDVKVEDPQKKSEAASMTLNRLIAGDFLESLGKELGLEVPPDMPYSTNILKTTAPEKAQGASIGKTTVQLPPAEGKALPTMASVAQNSVKHELPHNTREDESKGTELIHSNLPSGVSNTRETGPSVNTSDMSELEKRIRDDRKVQIDENRYYSRSSSSSSEDERIRKHLKRHHHPHRHRSSYSDSDSSDDNSDRCHSRSSRKRRSSQERRDSKRKHSKRYKEKREHSPRSSRHSARKEREEARREKRRRD